MSTKNNVMSFLGGAAVGAVIALLFAPDKGEVTRKRIRRAVEEGRDRAMDAFEDGRERLSEAIKDGREFVEDELGAARKEARKIERKVTKC